MTLDTLNRAVNGLAESISIVHAPVPEQLPDQPVNSEPGAGAAVSVTLLPASSEAEHIEPQSIPAGGPEVTLPEPLPTRLTESMYLAPPPEFPPHAISAEAKNKTEARCETKQVI
jgi:hypothetical protein